MSERISQLGGAERDLLLACSRLQLGPEHRVRVESLLDDKLDWDKIVLYARLHSVAPLMYQHLGHLDGARGAPERAREGLLRLYHRAGFQNRLYARENRSLLEEFEKAGIFALIPKGLSIVELVYGNLGLRPLIDLMFLVPREQVTNAKVLLAERGYERKHPRPIDGLYRWSCPQMIYKRRGEMHFAVIVTWNLITWPRLHALDPEGLWRRARRVTVSGRETLVLSPEDLVLYLGLQADNHGFFNRGASDRLDPAELLFAEWTNNRLVRFTDLCEAIRFHASELRWDVVVERAKQSGLDSAVHSSLSLADRLLDPGVDSQVLEELRPSGQGPAVRRWVTGALLASSDESERAPIRGRAGRWWRHRRPRSQILLGRLLGWIEVVFPSSDALRREYGVRSRAAQPPLYLFHATRSVIRSGLSFAWLWILSAFEGPPRQARSRHPDGAPRGARAHGSVARR